MDKELLEGTKLPEKVINLLDRLEKVFGIELWYEPNFYLYNRGGWPYAKGEAFTYDVCTFSMADGPDENWSKEIMQILKPIGFVCVSEGNNGLDPASSYGRDTYWHYHFIYKPEYIED